MKFNDQDSIKIGFNVEPMVLEMDSLMASRSNPPRVETSKKFLQISKSVKEIGLVEPVVVHQIKGTQDQFLILDGHLRILALKQLGVSKVECILATDDEAFTYNKHINRLSSVQEHLMILKAIENGVSEHRIAEALGVHVESIRRRRDLLRGICPEAVHVLKHHKLPVDTARILRKFRPVRQTEVAKLMVAANNSSVAYVKALYAATNPSQLRNPVKKRVKGLTDEERRSMELEMANIEREVKNVESSYGANMLRLVVANGYVARLLANDAISSYLKRNHVGLLDQLLLLQDNIDSELGVDPG